VLGGFFFLVWSLNNPSLNFSLMKWWLPFHVFSIQNIEEKKKKKRVGMATRTVESLLVAGSSLDSRLDLISRRTFLPARIQ